MQADNAASDLWLRAVHARRLAAQIMDSLTVERLRAYAQELEARAAGIEMNDVAADMAEQ